MKLKLFLTSSPDNSLPKVFDSSSAEMDIYLKPGTDKNYMNIDLLDIDPEAWNYAQVGDSFYFITDYEWVNARIVTLRLGIDLLQTYKDEILNLNTRIRRDMKVGDYGSATYEESGKVDVDEYESGVELIADNNFVLSILRGDPT